MPSREPLWVLQLILDVLIETFNWTWAITQQWHVVKWSSRKMVFRKKTSTEICAFVRFLKQGSSVSINEICRKAGVSRAMVHRCLKEDKKHRKLKKCPGWPKLIDAQTQPLMARKIRFLLLAKGGFSSKRLVKECSIELSISTSTVTQTLRRMGYHYLQVRKKGILTEEDKTASFAHKYNPYDQSLAQTDVSGDGQARAWTLDVQWRVCMWALEEEFWSFLWGFLSDKEWYTARSTNN